MSKGVNINRGEPQNWGVLGLHPLGMGAWLTARCPSPTYYLAEHGHSALTLSARADVYIRQYTIRDDVYVRRFSTISTRLIVQARILSVT